ncbi:NAD(P)H-hydrate dehydratase [Vibrio sp. WXL210]|uniref:NAD(P)H-hydrate dehydratase n=1 Tax=Vibrio sp. WXL210 TaxID=3450709 RepID=UPI003EC4DD44
MKDVQFLYTSEQIKRGEQKIAEHYHFPLYDLMLKAGQAVFEYGQANFPNAEHWLVVCGKGNNGGDGYVVADLARSAGFAVTLLELESCTDNQGDAAKARKHYISRWGAPQLATDELGLDVQADVVIDALLGTGLSGEVRSDYAAIIHQINAMTAPVVAVDLPSGLNADTGQAMGTAVRASATVSFIGVKRGLVTGEARHHCGKLHFAPLDIATHTLHQFEPSNIEVISDKYLSSFTIKRRATAHKGSHGRLLVVGGAAGMLGAVRLASGAALRVGAGLVRACVDEQSLPALQAGQPELMASRWGQCAQQQLAWADALVLGPGLGQGVKADSVCKSVFEHQFMANCAGMVVDADGLNYLANHPRTHHHWVLTPHPGEAARLLNCSIQEVERDRYAAVAALWQRYRGIIVLKGAGTLIFDGHTTWVCTQGNPGMATGGMGDVLAGLIGAFIAQGYSLIEATLLGVYIHSSSADVCAEQSGEIGLLASDLIPELRKMINHLADLH